MNGWKKLNEYYTKLEESPLYSAAVILNPQLGIRWLETRWKSREQLVWLQTAKTDLQDYWERWYQPRDDPPSSPKPHAPITAIVTLGNLANAQQLRNTSPNSSEFTDWLFSTPPEAPTLDSEPGFSIDRTNDLTDRNIR